MSDADPKPSLSPLAAALRWVELIFVFFAVPALFALWRATGPAFQDWLLRVGAPQDFAEAFRPQRIMFPLLFVFTAFALVLLLLDRRFEKGRFWRAKAIGPEFKRILATWVIGATGLLAVTWLFRPEWLFSFPRGAPLIWMFVMIGYPILSVYPQGVLYRLFFFHRYGPLLPSPAVLIAVNALAFGWMHIVFLNWIAPVLCLLGGVLFGYTYYKTKSAFAAGLEHALFGCWIFTVGLGMFFFGGAQRNVDGEFEPPQQRQTETQSVSD